MSIQIQKISDLDPLDLSTNTCSAYVIVSSKYGSTEEPPTNKNYKVDIQTSYNTIRQNISNLCSYTYTHIGELCSTVNTNSSDIADLKTCTTALRNSYNTLCTYTTTHMAQLYSCVSDLRTSHNTLCTYTTTHIGELRNCAYILSSYVNTIDNKYHNLCSYAYTYIGKLCGTVNTISCDIIDLKTCTSALQTSHNALCSYTYTHIGELKNCTTALRTSHNTLCSYAYTYIGELNNNAVKKPELYAYTNSDSNTYITSIENINADGGSLVKNTYIDNYLYYNTSYHTLSIGCNYTIIHNANNYTKHNLVVGDGNGILTNNDTQRVSYTFVTGNNNIAKRTQSSVIHGIANNVCDIIASSINGTENASCHNWTVFIAGDQNYIENSSYSNSIGTLNRTIKGNNFTAIGDYSYASYGYHATTIGRYNTVLCSQNIIEIGIGAYVYRINHPYSTTLLGNFGYLDNTNDNVEHNNILVIGDGYLQNTDPYRHNAIQLYENSQHQSYLEINSQINSPLLLNSPILLDANMIDPESKFIDKLITCEIVNPSDNYVINDTHIDKITPGHEDFSQSLYISYTLFHRYTSNNATYLCSSTINLNNALYGIAYFLQIYTH